MKLICDCGYEVYFICTIPDKCTAFGRSIYKKNDIYLYANKEVVMEEKRNQLTEKEWDEVLRRGRIRFSTTDKPYSQSEALKEAAKELGYIKPSDKEPEETHNKLTEKDFIIICQKGFDYWNGTDYGIYCKSMIKAAKELGYCDIKPSALDEARKEDKLIKSTHYIYHNEEFVSKSDYDKQIDRYEKAISELSNKD